MLRLCQGTAVDGAEASEASFCRLWVPVQDKELARLVLRTEVLWRSQAVVQVQEQQVGTGVAADKELADCVLCTEVLWGSDAQVVQVQEHQVSGQRLAQESLLQGKLTCPVWLQGQLRLLQEDKELARLLLCTEVLQWGSEAQVVQVQEQQVSGQRLAQESLLQGKLTCPVWLLEQLRLLEEDKLARLLLCTEGQLRLLQADKELADWVLCTEVLWGSDAQVVQVQEHQVSGQLRLLQVAQWSEAQVLQAHQQLLAQRCREVLLVSEAQVQRAQELQPGLRLAGESLVRQGQLTCSVSLQEPGQLRLLQLPQELAPWPCTEVLRRSTAQEGQELQEGLQAGQRLARESLQWQGNPTCSVSWAATFAAGNEGTGAVAVHGCAAGVKGTARAGAAGGAAGCAAVGTAARSDVFGVAAKTKELPCTDTARTGVASAAGEVLQQQA
ncbi:hypothetical protein AK812_SmicGene17788 [Symbiodinium microadriaticum]|uniref:Uncharacterized protein n=1 Tax=Symbiodinium microadriaticum TaxID=2951 RepID=A0A1Q9DWS9_SYMMI|nr:hypothetical protein AK812_SmicGene17788 [Symbiodinium microadriaticum]